MGLIYVVVGLWLSLVGFLICSLGRLGKNIVVYGGFEHTKKLGMILSCIFGYVERGLDFMWLSEGIM